jgi:Na+/melibiose symporter-like transporter
VLKLRPIQSSKLEENKSASNFSDVFKKDNFLTLLSVSIVMGGLYAEYGICFFISQKLGIDNIYLNGTLLGVVEVIGYILIYLFANKLGRKQINIYSNLIIMINSLILVIMDSIHNEIYHGVKKAVWFKIIETGK